MKCPKCGANVPAGATSCPSCGARFSQGKRCPACQAVIPSSAMICPKCGARQSAQRTMAPQPAAKSKPQKGGFRWWYILILLGVFILGIGIGFAAGSGTSGTAKEPTKKTSSSSETSSESVPEASEPTSEAKPAILDSGSLGDYQVSILSARLSQDYESNPALLVKYSFTNNSDENIQFAVAISAKAFQNGVQLEPAIMMGDDDYEAGQSLKEIQPGGTIELESAYVLSDQTSNIDIEVSELISFSKDKLQKTFILSELK